MVFVKTKHDIAGVDIVGVVLELLILLHTCFVHYRNRKWFLIITFINGSILWKLSLFKYSFNAIYLRAYYLIYYWGFYNCLQDALSLLASEHCIFYLKFWKISYAISFHSLLPYFSQIPSLQLTLYHIIFWQNSDSFFLVPFPLFSTIKELLIELNELQNYSHQRFSVTSQFQCLSTIFCRTRTQNCQHQRTSLPNLRILKLIRLQR